MYALVKYGLLVLAVISILFGFLGILPFSGVQFLITLGLVVPACAFSNYFIGRLLKIPTNTESWFITAFILFFILAPVTDVRDGVITVAAGLIAMVSKYVLVFNKKHIFNPAAISIFLLGLFGFGNGIWWVGSLVLLPFVTVLGLMTVRKIRRFPMFFVFVGTALPTIVLFNVSNGLSPVESVKQVFASWPLIFFGTIMLTEPLTMPPHRKLQMMYGGFVGILFGSQFHIGPLFASPEFALVVGNIFSFAISPKYRLMLKLKKSQEVGRNLYEFVFEKNVPFVFPAGQYMEWTLAGFKADLRGNRRYFTIASSPTEPDIKLGVKIDPAASSAFKKKLLSLKPGDMIVGSQLSGDFILPNDPSKKLVFIAGGIGVTPFRSMVQFMIDSKQKRDVVLMYTAADPAEFAYKNIFDKATGLGVKALYIVTKSENASKNWNGLTGRITPEMIQKQIPDFKDRVFYLSGPNAMVDGYKKILLDLSLPRTQIVTDYFPGF